MSLRLASGDAGFERVLRRYVGIIDALLPGSGTLSEAQRAGVRRLMIALFRAAAGHRAQRYHSYSELPGHSDGPILGRATLDRRRFVRIELWNEGQGFSVFWKWADEDFTADRAIHAKRRPYGYLSDRTELSISTDLSRDRLTAVFHLIRAYTEAAFPNQDSAMAFERTQQHLHKRLFRRARSRR